MRALIKIKMQTTANSSSILALDVGSRRIGVASANAVARLPRPLKTVLNDEKIFETIKNLVLGENAISVVIGLPRGMDSQETEQTKLVRNFGMKLEKHLDVPVYYQDEAVTSKLAEEALSRSGKPYDKSAIDALAATYILEDFLMAKKELLS